MDPDVRAYVRQARAEAMLLDGRPADALEAIEAALLEFEGSDEVYLVAPILVVGMTAAADLADAGGRSATPSAEGRQGEPDRGAHASALALRTPPAPRPPAVLNAAVTRRSGGNTARGAS